LKNTGDENCRWLTPCDEPRHDRLRFWRGTAGIYRRINLIRPPECLRLTTACASLVLQTLRSLGPSFGKMTIGRCPASRSVNTHRATVATALRWRLHRGHPSWVL